MSLEKILSSPQRFIDTWSSAALSGQTLSAFQGKPLSYNNLLDTDESLEAVRG